MNRTKIEWTDYTWNPVTGCLHGCNYCYARRLAEGRLKHRYSDGFLPTLWLERLRDPYQVKKPSKIFVCSMGDLFGKWVPGIWIQAILHVAHKNPQHTFQFLTKNPERYKEFEKDFSSNCWLGTTIEGGQWTRWDDLLCVDASVRFVSMEPLLSFDFDDFQYICETGVDWVIVGAQTNPYRQPKKEWIKDIIYLAKMYGIPLFLKNNLNYKPGIQEFPQMGVKR